MSSINRQKFPSVTPREKMNLYLNCSSKLKLSKRSTKSNKSLDASISEPSIIANYHNN